MASILQAVTRITLLGSLGFVTALPSAAQNNVPPPPGWPYLLSNGKQVTLSEAIQQRIVRPWQVIYDQHIDGWVFVSFTVMPDGVVKDARIAESLQYDCDVAALLAVRKLPPFEPLAQAGKPVATYMTVPVRFNWRAKHQPIK
ncbi:TonB family protein [Hymenobacter sp. HMF4947]|uniref:TonB family protein n=1 Tax=Hymenobacter ginkgonis TaxID=2682976 RepID=A0A7K1TCY4_9BACT|nr:energy transducer TonB [Hymenobacter ginkgonis]MVN76182.1 TonB family protein [Hymenobacter ginkgonis]